MTGWNQVEIRDSVIVLPVESLPENHRSEVIQNIGNYNLMFGETMYKSRPENGAHVMLPDYLAKQPLHILCTVATNFKENEMTFGEAIQHDRALAKEELKIETSQENIKNTHEFLKNLDIVENILKKGQEASLAEDVEPLVHVEFKNGNQLATDKGYKYLTYKYDGFRPVN